MTKFAQNQPPLRVLVLGTGAMGSLMAARLARAGQASISMAGTWSAALEAIDRHGVVVHEADNTWSVPVRVLPLHAVEAQDADVVMVLVKSHQTSAVAVHAGRALDADGIVVTLQNGLGNRETLAAHVGEGRVALGVTSMGATLLQAGHVADGGPGRTVLGTDVTNVSLVRRVAGLFEAVGVPVELDAAVDVHAWRKLAVNCAINPLTALLGVPNGQLLESRWTRAIMQRAARETAEVAAALGIDVGSDPVEAACEVARRTLTNRSSMLQDVARGANTEIDAINGAVVAHGRRVGVTTPVNTLLAQLIHELESGATDMMGRRIDAGADTWSELSAQYVRDRFDQVLEPSVHRTATVPGSSTMETIPWTS